MHAVVLMCRPDDMSDSRLPSLVDVAGVLNTRLYNDKSK